MNKQEMLILQDINNKLGFDIQKYGLNDESKVAHEQDNISNPFDKLSLEELLFIRNHRGYIKKLSD